MGVHVLHDNRDRRGQAALYCSTTDWAFGPVFSEDDYHTAEERAEAFLRWLKGDARTFTDKELESRYSAWLSQEAAQWAAEKAADEARWAE